MAQHRSEGRIRYGGVRAGPRVDKDVTELTGAGIRYDVVTVPIGVKSVTSDLLTYPPKKTEQNRVYLRMRCGPNLSVVLNGRYPEAVRETPAPERVRRPRHRVCRRR